jgi:2-polyprenyl-3-methyl-5-hydroxy-6-metoxy-1,4-benzoquinol methylase
MSFSKSEVVEKTLMKPDIHYQWENSYRTAYCEKFYENAFDYITNFLDAPKNSLILDAGCGSGYHSIRLAKRGFSVIGVDFSESILKMAEINIQSNNLGDRIKIQRENITSLNFSDETFDYILCWGVLMHIPDIERAISELTRVLRKGGMIIISEANMLSLELIIIRNLRRLKGKQKATRQPTGLEYWTITSAGKLFVRHADLKWLKKTFESSGFTVKKHVSGQFMEMYSWFSSQLFQSLIHKFNHLWFKYVKVPYLATANIIIFERNI